MLNWAATNPFKKADAKASGTSSPQQQPKQQDKTQQVDPNKDNKQQQNKQTDTGDDPLLNFSSLWQPDMDEKTGQPKVKQDNSKKSYLPSIDPKKFEEMVGKMDFTRDFTPEDIEAVKAGGDGAVQALANMMNGVGRRAFSSSFAAANKIAEQGFSGAKDRFMSEVPDHVREMMIDSELHGSEEFMKNPALAPIVSTVKKQYLQKFPKASPAEINSAIKQYFSYLGGELNKSKPDPNKQQDDNASRLRKGDVNADFMEWISKEVGEGNISPFAESEDNSQQDNSQQ